MPSRPKGKKVKKIGPIEKKYGRDYGIDNDAELLKYLRKKGYKSLAGILTRVGYFPKEKE